MSAIDQVDIKQEMETMWNNMKQSKGAGKQASENRRADLVENYAQQKQQENPTYSMWYIYI